MNIQTQLHELLFNPIALILIIAIIILLDFLYKNKQYKKTTYYQITKNSYLSVYCDKGKYGEYLIYKSLRSFEDTGGKFLFNIYVPRENNKTTEIDLLIICSKGLFVVESKNYDGWIFGNETQKNWTQVIYDNKNFFYNPIMQNALHIKCLKKLIGENVSMHSIIVFSDRCTLKKITIRSNNINVINRCEVTPVIAQICKQTQRELLTETEINDIYNKLYPYTQVGYETKIKHIANIMSR